MAAAEARQLSLKPPAAEPGAEATAAEVERADALKLRLLALSFHIMARVCLY